MKKMSFIIHSMRLRTLPLSLSGVVLGLILAFHDGYFQWSICLWTILTTISLQILSNLSNELGDYIAGTDNEEREGPLYNLAQGNLSVKDFKRSIVVMIVLCCVFGILLVQTSFKSLITFPAIATLLLGAVAIWSALHYTLGKNPYGYHGLGDLFVFLFFGLVAVMGAYFMAAHRLSWSLILPATTIGCFSVGVLNVNNTRDIISDAATRTTIPVKIGEKNAKIYQTFLIITGWITIIVFTSAIEASIWKWLFLISLPLYFFHIKGVWERSGKQLDTMLPFLVISSFLFSILYGIGLIIT